METYHTQHQNLIYITVEYKSFIPVIMNNLGKLSAIVHEANLLSSKSYIQGLEYLKDKHTQLLLTLDDMGIDK